MYILLALLQPFDGLFSNSQNFTKNRNGERIYITELGDTGAKRSYGAKWSSLVVTYLLFWLQSKFPVREALTLRCFLFTFSRRG